LVVPGSVFVRAAMFDLKPSGNPALPGWMAFYCTNAVLIEKSKHVGDYGFNAFDLDPNVHENSLLPHLI